MVAVPLAVAKSTCAVTVRVGADNRTVNVAAVVPASPSATSTSSIVNVGSGSTTCVICPLLDRNPGGPSYSAVITWFPGVRADVVTLACPPASTGAGPASVVAPSLKTTSPTVTGEPAETVAVNVTGSPESDGFWDE